MSLSAKTVKMELISVRVLFLFFADVAIKISFTALASVTYDSPEEIIGRIQLEMKHK